MKPLLFRLLCLAWLLQFAALTACCGAGAAAPADAAAPGPAARRTFDLSQWLAEDANELRGIPWLSPCETACRALGLAPREPAVTEARNGIVELIIPVWLEPFGCDASLTLRYTYLYELDGKLVNDGGTALVEVRLVAAAGDEAAAGEMLRTLLRVADRPDFPVAAKLGDYRLRDRDPVEVYVDTFLELWRLNGEPRRTLAQESDEDRAQGRICFETLTVQLGGYSLPEITGALGSPVVVKITLDFSAIEKRSPP